MLVISTQNWSFLAKFAKKNPVKSADFSMNLPLKILRNLTFSAKMPRNRSIFLRILTFLPRNRRIFPRILTFSRENPTKSANFSANFDFFPAKIPRNRPIFPRLCPWKSREILRFFPRNIRSPDLRRRTSTCTRFNLKFLRMFSKKLPPDKAWFYFFSPNKLVRLFILREVKPSPDSKMIKLLTCDILLPPLQHSR